jgi:AhpD family alkylhydroperoxidase
MGRSAKGKKILGAMLKVRTSYPADVMKSREVLAREAPEYLELFHKTYLYILHERSALPPKVKELIIIAVDAAQFYERGLRSHIKSALKAGATRDEIVEALLASSLAAGIHALSVSLPIFDEVIGQWEKEQKATRKQKKP